MFVSSLDDLIYPAVQLFSIVNRTACYEMYIFYSCKLKEIFNKIIIIRCVMVLKFRKQWVEGRKLFINI